MNQTLTDDTFTSAAEAFAAFCATIAALRDPQTGCPWDLEQTHATLRKYMLEEAYEAVEVMHPIVPSKLREELGDVLLQVVLNAQMAKDDGQFNITDVIQSINAKMRRRHPHVFGSEADKNQRTMPQIYSKWAAIKAEENAKITPKEGLFAGEKLHSYLPSSRQAVAIGTVTAKINFDWGTAQEILTHLKSEIAELETELQTSEVSLQRAREEIGDVYFTLAQVCRKLNLDPEIVGLDANKKFLRRFESMEQLAKERGISLESSSLAALENLWRETKAREQN